MGDVDPDEATMLFVLLEDGAGHIDYNDFSRGCLRLRQAPKAIDVVTILHEQRQIKRTCASLEMEIACLLDAMSAEHRNYGSCLSAKTTATAPNSPSARSLPGKTGTRGSNSDEWLLE